MLIAKLNTELELIIQISPVKTETRTVNCFYVIPLGYKLGTSKSDFHVHFCKENEVPKNPANHVEGEGEMKKEYTAEKIFYQTLTSEELANWGSDDKSLLEIIANKNGLVISEYLNIEI